MIRLNHTNSVTLMEREVLEKIHRRIVKSFMDVLVLAELKNGHPMSGYDIIGYIPDRFGILVSSGTVYSLLYSMERDGLIEGKWAKRKRVYTLTEKGDKEIEAILNANDKIKGLLASLLKGQCPIENCDACIDSI
jgi:DNA-binding PadR family transcriptional regulator